MHKKHLLSTSALALAAVAAFVSFKVCAKDSDGIAARVNDDTLTVAEIKANYEANPQIASQVPFEQFYAKSVDGFVNGKMLYQAAEKAKVLKSEQFSKQMELAKEDVARKVYLENILSQEVTPEAVKNFYENEYLKNFKSQKEIKAKHILVADEATAKDIIKKLGNKGDFDKLAEEFSKDRSDLGYFTANMMVPEFSKAAFAMDKGTYSKEPVKTQFGYHIIKVEDIRDSKPLDMKTVEPQIRQVLSQLALAKTFDGIAKDSKIEIFDLSGNKIDLQKPEENK